MKLWKRPENGTKKSVARYALLPVRVGATIIWLEHYVAVYEYLHFPGCGPGTWELSHREWNAKIDRRTKTNILLGLALEYGNSEKKRFVLKRSQVKTLLAEYLESSGRPFIQKCTKDKVNSAVCHAYNNGECMSMPCGYFDKEIDG
jgi:hypothetical protein